METVTLSIDGMTCGHCVASVRRALEAVPGVEVERVGIGSAELRLDEGESDATDATNAALAAVRDAGYEAVVGAAPAVGTTHALPLTPLRRSTT